MPEEYLICRNSSYAVPKNTKLIFIFLHVPGKYVIDIKYAGTFRTRARKNEKNALSLKKDVIKGPPK